MKHLVVWIMAMGFSMFGFLANAQSIRVHEDFEGAELFKDQNFPKNRQSTAPIAADVALKGFNLAYVDGVNTSAAAKMQFGVAHALATSNTSVLTTERFYQGAKSVKMVPHQSSQITGTQPSSDMLRFRIEPITNSKERMHDFLIQFALSMSPADSWTSAGIPIGYVRLMWRNDNVNYTGTAPSNGVRINLIQRADGGADIVTTAPFAAAQLPLGVLYPGADKWALVTILVRQQMGLLGGTPVTTASKTINSGTWNAVDLITTPSTSISKGPRNYKYESGVTVFVDIGAERHMAYVSPEEIDDTRKWGNDGIVGSADGGTDDNLDQTGFMGFIIAPYNIKDGTYTMYVDDLYYGHIAGNQNGGGLGEFPFLNQEIAARISDFGPDDLVSASVKHWDMY